MKWDKTISGRESVPIHLDGSCRGGAGARSPPAGPVLARGSGRRGAHAQADPTRTLTRNGGLQVAGVAQAIAKRLKLLGFFALSVTALFHPSSSEGSSY